MKVVVADTSPISYLILIDCIDLLGSLYSRIVIPDAVFNELTAVGAPPQVAAWIRSRPDWIEVRSAPFGVPLQLAANESDLDAGELAANRLALAEHDSLLLIDDAAGRSVASRLGVANTGTLGVILAGARDGLGAYPFEERDREGRTHCSFGRQCSRQNSPRQQQHPVNQRELLGL